METIIPPSSSGSSTCTLQVIDGSNIMKLKSVKDGKLYVKELQPAQATNPNSQVEKVKKSEFKEVLSHILSG
ncbi:hypothetical protein Lalb_Chr01g0001251 [Lupinus albus]|uniref:Uncharacterized protein n=1 Tax=Lupinus albus TaxID=3870 RepID=A0A6A4R2P7_LUPAL|nr:hypothetical protein Lalb_Chr01g0001251 [Lupinus albus]